jgi:cob(I)alamin adenosyltransferase
VAIRAFGRESWVHPDHPEQEDREKASAALAYARQVMLGDSADIVVLDEINVALDYGLLDLDRVFALLDDRPPGVELILTGRNAHPEVIDRADLVTEMRKIAHPHDRGISGRRGVEF